MKLFNIIKYFYNKNKNYIFNTLINKLNKYLIRFNTI